MKDILQLDVTVSTPWSVRAGQYVFLWIPGVSFWSFLQAHPFTIAWWDADEAGKLRLSFLVRQRRGWTSHLVRHLHNQLITVIDGPHGICHDFGEFGNVIMVATGSGILAQMPYIRAVLDGYRDYTVKTRQLTLLWEYDDEGKVNEKPCSSLALTVLIHQPAHRNWVQRWMDELLRRDNRYVGLLDVCAISMIGF